MNCNLEEALPLTHENSGKLNPVTQGSFFSAEPKLEIWFLILGYSLINIYWYFYFAG